MSSTYAGPRRLRTTVLGSAAALALGLGLTGCGGSSTPSGAASTSASASASPSGIASPSASPSTTFPKPKVVDGSITATDKTFTLGVPDGWTSPTRGVPAPFVMALQDQNTRSNQLVVSSFSGVGDAAASAKQTATGLAAQKIACDPGTVGGRTVVDCHYAFQGDQVHKMLFPLVHDGTSALVLFQTLATSRSAAFAKLQPILATWRWSDGSVLAKS